MKIHKSFLSAILLFPWISLIHAEEIEYTYTYDEVGRLVEVQQAALSVLEYTYDLRSNITRFRVTVEEVALTSIWPGPAGDKLGGIGWLNDAFYPFIWHYQEGSYFYIIDAFSTLESIWGYAYADSYWFWTSDAIGGWYYDLSDPGGWDNWSF